jgi:hypothetical protein
VLLGTRNPCFREPELASTRSNAYKKRAPNFANTESYGFFLTSRAGRGSVENNDPSRRAPIKKKSERHTSYGASAPPPSDHQRRPGNLAGAAAVEVAP